MRIWANKNKAILVFISSESAPGVTLLYWLTSYATAIQTHFWSVLILIFPDIPFLMITYNLASPFSKAWILLLVLGRSKQHDFLPHTVKVVSWFLGSPVQDLDLGCALQLLSREVSSRFFSDSNILAGWAKLTSSTLCFSKQLPGDVGC